MDVFLVAERTHLGDVLDKWLRRLRVSKAHVARFGRVSPNTLNYISQGTTAHPEMDTVRRIAQGLATDPSTEFLDEPTYRRAWRELAEAAGHSTPTFADPVTSVEASIGQLARHPGAADEWADFIRDYPDATPDQIRALRALYENLVRSGMLRLGK
jgi:transcriptional regulator with XRE-family HTH domain